MDRIVALISLIIVLGLVNWSILKKEDHLTNGKTVYMELAWVGPRSLMQGDYMALRFRIGTEVYNALPKVKEYRHWRHNADGYVVVKLDKEDIASYKALYTNQILADNEILMRYRVRNGAVKFAANAFFFQEGHAKHYDTAQYGLFRVDTKSELLLVSMHNDDLRNLEPGTEALIRRSSGHASPVLECGPLTLDVSTTRLTVAGRPVELTALEFRTLAHLMRHEERVVSKTELTEHLYDQGFDGDSNVIEVLVNRLRNKLGADLIKTHRGLGYQLTVPGDDA